MSREKVEGINSCINVQLQYPSQIDTPRNPRALSLQMYVLILCLFTTPACLEHVRLLLSNYHPRNDVIHVEIRCKCQRWTFLQEQSKSPHCIQHIDGAALILCWLKIARVSRLAFINKDRLRARGFVDCQLLFNY